MHTGLQTGHKQVTRWALGGQVTGATQAITGHFKDTLTSFNSAQTDAVQVGHCLELNFIYLNWLEHVHPTIHSNPDTHPRPPPPRAPHGTTDARQNQQKLLAYTEQR